MKNFTRILPVLFIVMLLTAFLANQGRAQTTLLTEGWESATNGGNTPPAGWGLDVILGSNITYYMSVGTYPSVNPYEGSRLVDFESFSYTSGTNRLKRTTAISTVGYSNISVDFEWYTDNGYAGTTLEGVIIQWSTNGTTWTDAGTTWMRYATTNQWVLNTQALPVGAANQATLYVAFQFNSQYGDDCHMDIIHVKGLQTGTLAGNVKNCLSNANLANATVTVMAGSPLAPYTGVTNATGNYTIAGIPTGIWGVTATCTGYQAYPGSNVTINANLTTTFNFCMNPLPATLTGFVTNAATGAPVVGAKVQTTRAGEYTYSTGPNGAYNLPMYTAYTGTVWASKDGFADLVIASATYTPPTGYTANIALLEATNPPSQPFTAVLNSGQTAVNLNWGLPKGNYQLIYDNGIETSFTVWEAEGNLDAVKFTPAGYPATLLGCMINIGKSTDYTLPGHPVTFKVGVFDATGPGGMPGTQISGWADFTIVATTFGWYDYPTFFSTPVNIASGSFYIVTKQVGAFPNAAGIALDTTNQQLRSYQKFATGNGPWVPANGNFLIRAHMYGSGGPFLSDSPSNTESIVGYQVWRFLQGQESLGPVGWTSIGTPTATSIVDGSWPSLPCQSYRWGVEAQYTGNRWSNPTFSNAVGKCWTANVIVNISLSCDSASPNNAVVTLSRHNPGTPPPTYDSIYIKVSDASGIVHFNNIYKGVYDLTVTIWNYASYTQTNITIMGDQTINPMLLQNKLPPAWATPFPGGGIDPTSLLATWNKPHLSVPLLTETWSSGNFTANQWTVSGDAAGAWLVAAFGNPSPSAEFYWLPTYTNYNGYLTSKVMTGIHSPVLTLNYDIYLSNFSSGGESLAVELWNGTSWVALKTYTNSGNIAWTSEHLDISSVTNNSFQIRFHTFGANSYDINNWNVDNIKVTAEGPTGADPCILGYNFYLNNVLSGFAPDTFYNIPPGEVNYGGTFTGCVNAIYGSGYSTKICSTFVSHFLCPITNLTATNVTNAAYLTWTKPQCLAGQDLCFVYDDGTMENGLAFIPGYTAWLGNKFIITPTFSGQIKSFNLLWWNNPAGTVQNWEIDVYNLAGTMIGSSQLFTVPVPAPTTFMTVTLTTPIPFTGQFYGMVKWASFSGSTHWLGMDQNGTYTNSGVGYYYDGTTFANASTLGYGACVFTVRACAFVYGEDKMVTLGPQPVAEAPQSAPVIMPTSATSATETMGSVDSHDYTYTSPDSPLAGTGLIGYNVYHHVGTVDNFHHYVPGPDSLSTYCYNMDPGVQCFNVKAKYDLTVYGFPGTFGEALAQAPGPACTDLVFGYPLPFFEPWEGGTIQYQGWTNGANWQYTPAIGNPSPSANYTWQPIRANYKDTLKTPTIDASAWTCAKIYLDFDIRLDDRDANGTEMMDISLFFSNSWHKKVTLTNTGSFDWTTKHVDITGAKGLGFKVGFIANGTNTQHILNWYVDNIHAYGVCSRPVDLNNTQSRDTIHLTWSPPDCGPSGIIMCYIFDDGTMENGLAFIPGYTAWLGNLFPVAASVNGTITSFDLLWWNNPAGTVQNWEIDVYSAAGTMIGSSQLFTVPVPAPTTFMTVTLDVPIAFTGPFYGMVKWASFSGSTHWLGMDQDGPWVNSNVGMYYDGTTFSNASTLGYGACVFTVRFCALVSGEDKAVRLGPTPIASTKPVDNRMVSAAPHTPGQSIDSGDHTTMDLATDGADTSQLMGYNIFRYDSVAGGVVHFRQLNTSLWTQTNYTDVVGMSLQQVGTYMYYVTSVFNNSVTNTQLCESPGSDTITITFPHVGINEVSGGAILIYPNPANDVVNVKSDYDISRIEVMNFIGQTVYSENTAGTKLSRINTSSMQAGVYFIKVTTSKGIRTVKITIVR